jgi:hypothetical protein
MDRNIYKRLADIESVIMLQKTELKETIEYAYKKACEFRNEELAAEMARKLRNKLLDESDKQMSFDTLSLDTSSIEAFLASVNVCLNNDWAKYRQELRDITSQEGFPFDINFPSCPDEIIKND